MTLRELNDWLPFLSGMYVFYLRHGWQLTLLVKRLFELFTDRFLIQMIGERDHQKTKKAEVDPDQR